MAKSQESESRTWKGHQVANLTLVVKKSCSSLKGRQGKHEKVEAFLWSEGCFHVDYNCGNFTFLLLSDLFPCNSISLVINIPVAVSFSRNCLDQRKFFHWVGSNMWDGERQTGRVKRGGLADTACYFSSTSHWLSALGSPLEKPCKCRMAWKQHPSVATYHRGRMWWKKCYVFFPLLYI